MRQMEWDIIDGRSMTERTIKEMAKELAGVFYEDSARTPGFRRAFPTFKAYMRGQWHQPDGTIKIDKPGWLYHKDLARKMLTMMLGQPDSRVSPVMKERIYDALIAETERATAKGAKQVTQRKELH